MMDHTVRLQGLGLVWVLGLDVIAQFASLAMHYPRMILSRVRGVQ